MRKCLRVFILATTITSSPSFAGESTPSHWQLTEPDRALRSAYFNKEPVHDSRPSDLFEHFSRVLEILQYQENDSLIVALKRWERSSGPWTKEQRRARYEQLSGRRRLHQAKLAMYRDWGQFPINDYASRSTPVFVDRRNTACAVGHLMRASGASEAVASIAATNNFVYVPEQTGGPLVDWILSSGFTQEEAALIQPSYPPVLPESLSIQEMIDGKPYYWPQDGPPVLKFELFGIRTKLMSSERRVKEANIDNLGWGSEAAYTDGFKDPFVVRKTPSTHYAVIGSPHWVDGENAWIESDSLDGQAGATHEIFCEFEVTSLNRDWPIGGVTLQSDSLQHNALPDGDDAGRIRISAKAFGGEHSIGELALDSNDDGSVLSYPCCPDWGMSLNAWDFVAFDSLEQSVRLTANVKLTGTTRFESLVFLFNLLPRPSASINEDRRMTMTVPTKPEYRYALHRAEVLGGPTSILQEWTGSGYSLSASWDASGSTSRRAFFWISENEPEESVRAP